jgi:hypothetical protein
VPPVSPLGNIVTPVFPGRLLLTPNRRFTLKMDTDVRDRFTSPINHEHRDYSTQRTGPPNLLNFPDVAAHYTNRIQSSGLRPVML